MASVINTNIASLNSQRSLNKTQNAVNTAIQRLSSGLRVNSSKDDAAGLAIAERMNAQIKGMNVAIRNANDAVSLAQVADGALGQISEMAQRMRELAVQSANATNGEKDRESLNQEYTQLALEITRTINGTKFNGLAIIGSDAQTPLTFQIGANTDTTTERIELTGMSDLSADTTVTDVTGSTIDGTDATNALAAMDFIDTMLDTINSQRAVYGAAQNRFDSVISSLQVSVENQTAARSRIMDADFAAETANLTSAQVLQQAGQAMLAQANSAPSGVLALLRNLG
ncbi:MAG: flagellin [Burkholderiaceae bacterium]